MSKKRQLLKIIHKINKLAGLYNSSTQIAEQSLDSKITKANVVIEKMLRSELDASTILQQICLHPEVKKEALECLRDLYKIEDILQNLEVKLQDLVIKK
jgi:hypothetical protein